MIRIAVLAAAALAATAAHATETSLTDAVSYQTKPDRVVQILPTSGCQYNVIVHQMKPDMSGSAEYLTDLTTVLADGAMGRIAASGNLGMFPGIVIQCRNGKLWTTVPEGVGITPFNWPT